MSFVGIITNFFQLCASFLADWFWKSTMLQKVVARALYLPSILRLALREGPAHSWFNRVDETVILGALPFRSQAKELVEKENVKAVLSFNEGYELSFFTNSKEEWRKCGVEQHWFPTVDFQPPPLSSVWDGLALIEKYRALNQSVYVHCKAGKGRSAMMVVSYLIKSRNIGMEEAINFLRQKRPQISINVRQKSRIREFQEELRTKRE